MNSYHLKLYSVVFVSLLLIISLFGYTVISTNQYNDDSKVPAPDIEVTKEASSISGYPESLITFTITVENTGFWELNPVDITDTLPSTMTYVSSSPPGTVSGNEITWTTDLLNWGESKTFELVASINWDAPSVLHNHVNATGISEVFPVFDEDTVSVTVLSPIAVEKAVHYNSVGPWNDEGIVINMAGPNAYDWVTFRINVTNLLDVPLNITVEDVLPDGLINGDHYYPFVPDELSGNSIFWYLDGIHHDLLYPYETKTFAIRAEMGECGVEYVNDVFIHSRNGFSNIRVDSDTASVMWTNCDLTEDVEQTMCNRGFPIRHAVDGDWGGSQSFMPTMNSIAKVDVYLRKFGTPEFDLTVELRKDDSEGILLDTITVAVDDVSSDWGWLEFDFEDELVNPGTEYFITIPPAPSGMPTSFGYEWGYAFGDMYPDGCFWFTRDGGNLWRDLPDSYEFTFKTFGYN